MSIDWIALWSALAALPIVLLLSFTGCVLNRHGTKPDNPDFTFPGGLNLHALSLSVTMTIVGVNDTPPPETKSFNSALDIPPKGDTLTFSTIDSSKVNTGPSFGGEGEIGPFLTLTCDCTIVLEGNPTQKVSLSIAHDGDDAESLDLVFTLSVTGSGMNPGDYSLA
jgi:hypothetical protein